MMSVAGKRAGRKPSIWRNAPIPPAEAAMPTIAQVVCVRRVV
jgi:hypothetical protein